MSGGKAAKKTITVIGGGPSGMTAAIFAAKQQAAKVRLIEKNPNLGRKLLATGNGRCNLTNSNCPDAADTLEFFSELGLLTREEAEGRIYPYSEQAAAVLEVLASELACLGVEILCGTEVKDRKKRIAFYDSDRRRYLLIRCGDPCNGRKSRSPIRVHRRRIPVCQGFRPHRCAADALSGSDGL
jgi:predicted flavoprotein YhiN